MSIFKIVVLFSVSIAAEAFDRVDQRVLDRYKQHYSNVDVEFCVSGEGEPYRTAFTGGSRADRKLTMSLVESVLSAREFAPGCYKMKGSQWGDVHRASPN